ncbi:amino acid ABC transporter substrate-binding protein [Tateyamaria pelophila]|uniref:amino acid ABC transporter substrate-binding protein n=1 Tax=Tateyamaria pelophila TaxID=328415 RepID=UPI001CC16941|nr:amino acid ABC transporter substrate-binding protein [Tateyamaria pelophila]
MRILSAALAATLLLPTLAFSQTLDRIKESGEFVVGFRTDAAPLSFLSDNGPQGYSPEICVRLAPSIATAAGLESMDMVFEPVTTENRFEKVASGEIDLLCGAATITLSRRELVDFSAITYVDGTTIALKVDAPESFEALAGQKVGVRSGTTTLDALNNSLAAANIDAEVVEFADHTEGMAALEADEITAYFADQSILMNLVLAREDAADFKVFDQILTVEKQGFAMQRGDTDFRLAVDAGLSVLFEQGDFEEVYKNTIPGARPGFAIEAMFLLSPTLP